METNPPNLVSQVLGQLLQHPDPLRERELERALQRLQAARPDAAYLLLHRVLVLELALQRLRGAPAAGTEASPGTPNPSPAAVPRSLLRDAAVVATGVIAGQAIWQALDEPAAGFGEVLPDADGWL